MLKTDKHIATIHLNNLKRAWRVESGDLNNDLLYIADRFLKYCKRVFSHKKKKY